jgi:hypothetical protein
MISFESCTSDARILHYVYAARAKLAKRRNRQHLIYDVTGNATALPGVAPVGDEKILASILPPRRQWKKLDQKARTGSAGQPLDSVQKTVRILNQTVRWFRRKMPDAPFLKGLAGFCDDVRAYMTGANPTLPSPRIVPVRKEQGDTKCRPIAVYPLAAKIAICLTNRYLSEHFDAHFEPCSLAFRTPEAGPRPCHHDAFEQIALKRRSRSRCDFWVTECDIQKFFDTVNHAVLKRAFKKLIAKVNRAHPEQPVNDAAVRLFMSYLASYSFNRDVLPLNDARSGYFENLKMAGCHFGWVGKELKESRLYRSFGGARIGVPQGGALSGLIANILLDEADKALTKNADQNLTYVRYCDDMIIMHPRKGRCGEYMEMYQTELRKLKLLPHPARAEEYGRKFWENKSKKPYKWGPTGRVPWIGFVGYEISVAGEVRVRKSSLKKEMQKQYRIVQEVMGRIKDRPRGSRKKIEESIAGRLIQMSVGRVRLHNFQTAKSESCWVSGFRHLTDNPHSRTQMKRLDACRNSLLRRLRKRLEAIEEPEAKRPSKPRQLVYHGKPFSYFYHAIEKHRHEPTDRSRRHPE